MESKGHISNISRRTYHNKMNISGHYEADIQLTRRQHIHATTTVNTTTITNISNYMAIVKTKGMKGKF